MRKDVFTAGEVAKICRASRGTVNRWLNEGELKGYRPTKNADWRVTRKELVKFMKKNGMPLEFLGGDKIKILVVDDEINMTRAIKRTFQNVDQFHIETANSGFSAGTKLESFRPDVVVLDIYLGDMDGREFFKHIREQPELNGTKVIGISGKLREDEIQPLLDQGFDDFLQKPFKMEELKKTIINAVKE